MININMKHRHRYFLFSILLCITGIARAQSPEYLPIADYYLHHFDPAIRSVIGFEKANILYFSEKAVLTSVEEKELMTYQSRGCAPFYVIWEGKVEETGYDCRTFFCTGYRGGIEQCRDWKNNIVDGHPIDERMRIHGDTFAVRMDAVDHTDTYKRVHCRPFQLIEFETVISGDGYSCEEVGQHPYFSPAYTCIRLHEDAVLPADGDYQYDDDAGYICDLPVRSNEFTWRAIALAYRPPMIPRTDFTHHALWERWFSFEKKCDVHP